MSPPSERVDAEVIYDTLRSDILTGELSPGTPAREVALAARFGVSRTPVREALLLLQHDRLLVASTRGLVVRAVEPDEVIAIYDMRILLEGEAAAQAAEHRREADLLRLTSLLDRDRALTDPADAVRTSTNIEFHDALLAATHNPVLTDLLGRLAVHLIRTPHSTLSAPGRWEQALREHATLLRAVKAHDSDRARQVARRHLARAKEIRLALLSRG